MSQFKNVTVTALANMYFDGKVTSRTVEFADGSTKTLGIMSPGTYEFGTDAAELMEIQAGELKVLLPGADDWQTFTGGQAFNVPGNAKFQVEVATTTDYICSYL